jgi:hypothetical protein
MPSGHRSLDPSATANASLDLPIPPGPTICHDPHVGVHEQVQHLRDVPVPADEPGRRSRQRSDVGRSGRADRRLRRGREALGEQHGQVVGDQRNQLVGSAERPVGDAVVPLDARDQLGQPWLRSGAGVLT